MCMYVCGINAPRQLNQFQCSLFYSKADIREMVLEILIRRFLRSSGLGKLKQT